MDRYIWCYSMAQDGVTTAGLSRNYYTTIYALLSSASVMFLPTEGHLPLLFLLGSFFPNSTLHLPFNSGNSYLSFKYSQYWSYFLLETCPVL